MADIFIKIEKDGIRIWRTVASANGGRIRVPGSESKVAGKEELIADLPAFRKSTGRHALSGELDDNRTG